jgi:hypothetical protein
MTNFHGQPKSAREMLAAAMPMIASEARRIGALMKSFISFAPFANGRNGFPEN